MSTVHKPVLLKEVLEYLNPQLGQNFIDCTFGGGGHSLAILEKISPDGQLLAIDANEQVKELSRKIVGPAYGRNFKLITDNFVNLKQIVKAHFKNDVSGILLDLGLSSDQLEKSNKGFSFQKEESLDMRFNKEQEWTAADILNFYSLEDIYDVLKNYGDYPRARHLSERILKQRKLKKFKNTSDLVDLVLEVSPRQWKDKTHPATKVFQALRIAVNNELGNLEDVLPQAVEILESGGKLVVISFHSSEDKIVKTYFKEHGRGENKILNILTKKPLVPTQEEIKDNPRSRSAKMRVVEKI
ncbi:MAG: 16S rRNA (cytosine(1402)-N(4))-methyltransferase RsmH [Patescibacteria group bacterium]